MEPMLPTGDSDLGNLALTLVGESARTAGQLHPITERTLRGLLRTTNSYYSNLIEGHNTHPVDIERAMRADYSDDPAKRALQIESRAHIEIQQAIETRLGDTTDLEVCGSEFLCWIHDEFYQRLHREHGVRVLTSTLVTSIEGEEQVEHVHCADGTVLDADLVIIAVGVLPHTRLAAEAGLAVEDGILVDEFACTSDPNIVSAGDCPRHFNPIYQRRVRLESVQNAMDQAKTTLATVKDFVGEDSDTRHKVDRALEEIAAAARSMNSLMDYLERHPESLLKGK